MVHHKARWSSGLRLRPLTPATRVRISYGSPIVGVDGGGGTPVPIPNTAVKPTCADDTWLEAAWKNRQAPTSVGFFPTTHSSLAQLVEHAAVNRRVVGSSPTGGAKNRDMAFVMSLFFYCYWNRSQGLCFGRRIAAVNWLRCRRCQRQMQAVPEQEETRSFTPRQPVKRLCF